MLHAAKGVRGKGRQPLSPPQHTVTRAPQRSYSLRSCRMRFILAGVLFAISVCFQLKCIFVFTQMRDDVNRALGPGEQISAFGPSWLRGKIIKLHRQHYLGSTLPRNLYRWWWAEIISFMAALACVIRFV